MSSAARHRGVAVAPLSCAIPDEQSGAHLAAVIFGAGQSVAAAEQAAEQASPASATIGAGGGPDGPGGVGTGCG